MSLSSRCTMTQAYTCPECQQEMRIERALLGGVIECPRCKSTFITEKPAPSREEPPPPQPLVAPRDPVPVALANGPLPFWTVFVVTFEVVVSLIIIGLVIGTVAGFVWMLAGLSH